MKMYVPYYQRVNNVLCDALHDIIDMFKEHDVTEVRLRKPMKLNFEPRFAGDERSTHEIDTIELHGGMIDLRTGDQSYFLYDLSNSTEIAFIYDMIYQHFYRN